MHLAELPVVGLPEGRQGAEYAAMAAMANDVFIMIQLLVGLEIELGAVIA